MSRKEPVTYWEIAIPLLKPIVCLSLARRHYGFFPSSFTMFKDFFSSNDPRGVLQTCFAFGKTSKRWCTFFEFERNQVGVMNFMIYKKTVSDKMFYLMWLFANKMHYLLLHMHIFLVTKIFGFLNFNDLNILKSLLQWLVSLGLQTHKNSATSPEQNIFAYQLPTNN